MALGARLRRSSTGGSLAPDSPPGTTGGLVTEADPDEGVGAVRKLEQAHAEHGPRPRCRDPMGLSLERIFTELANVPSRTTCGRSSCGTTPCGSSRSRRPPDPQAGGARLGGGHEPPGLAEAERRHVAVDALE